MYFTVKQGWGKIENAIEIRDKAAATYTKETEEMKISVIKSANEVVIGSWQITNEKLAKLMITLNDAKNNLKKRRYTHWVKVSFEGAGSVEMGDEPMCIGDYDEYQISPDTRVIVPIEDTEDTHKQYVCSTLNTPTLLQNKTLTENEEIIIVYTEIINEEGSRSAVNEMLLTAMKRCLFEYQMKAYTDYAGQPIDKELFDKRVQQILNILPDLDALITKEGKGGETTEAMPQQEMAEEAVQQKVEILIPQKPLESQQAIQGISEENIEDEIIDASQKIYEDTSDVQEDETSEDDELDKDEEKMTSKKVQEIFISEQAVNSDPSEEGVKWVKIDLPAKEQG